MERCWPGGATIKWNADGTPACAATAIRPDEGRKSFPSGEKTWNSQYYVSGQSSIKLACAASAIRPNEGCKAFPWARQQLAWFRRLFQEGLWHQLPAHGMSVERCGSRSSLPFKTWSCFPQHMSRELMAFLQFSSAYSANVTTLSLANGQHAAVWFDSRARQT